MTEKGANGWHPRLTAGWCDPPNDDDFERAARGLEEFARDEMLPGGLLPTVKQAVGLAPGASGGTWRDALLRLAQLVRRPTATWGERFRCSRCGSDGKPLLTSWVCCPHCGARLTGEEVGRWG